MDRVTDDGKKQRRILRLQQLWNRRGQIANADFSIRDLLLEKGVGRFLKDIGVLAGATHPESILQLVAELVRSLIATGELMLVGLFLALHLDLGLNQAIEFS